MGRKPLKPFIFVFLEKRIRDTGGTECPLLDLCLSFELFFLSLTNNYANNVFIIVRRLLLGRNLCVFDLAEQSSLKFCLKTTSVSHMSGNAKLPHRTLGGTFKKDVNLFLPSKNERWKSCHFSVKLLLIHVFF